MIVGLTGGIGSGKSTVLKFFRELQVPVLESDQLTRDLMQPGQEIYHKIVEHFGTDFLQGDQQINRRALRETIFQSEQEKKWLEALLHPELKRIIKIRALAIQKNQYLIVEIPLLIETNFQEAMDRVLLIDCSEHLQKMRIQARDHIPLKMVDDMMAAQVSRKTRQAHADDIILNEGTMDELKEKIVKLHDFYKHIIS